MPKLDGLVRMMSSANDPASPASPVNPDDSGEKKSGDKARS